MLTQFALLMAAAGLTLAALAGYVAWRRDTSSGWSLAVLLVSVAWWGLAYSVELTVDVTFEVVASAAERPWPAIVVPACVA